MADPVLFSLQSENGFFLQTAVIQESFSLSKTANFAQQEIMNRSSPFITYAASGPLMLAVTLSFVAGIGGLVVADINNIGKGLLSLTFPMKSGINPPPVCTINMGAGTIVNNLPFVCTSCDLKWGENNIWDSTGDPMALSANLSFLELEPVSVDSGDWGGGALKNYKYIAF
jgi:hypothetical protein